MSPSMTTATDGLSCGTCGRCVISDRADPLNDPWARITSAIVRLHISERYGICDMDAEIPIAVPLHGAMECHGDFWTPR